MSFNDATLGRSDVSIASKLLLERPGKAPADTERGLGRAIFELGDGIGTGRINGDGAGDADFKPRGGGGGGARLGAACKSEDEEDGRRLCTSGVGDPEKVPDVARGRGLCAPPTPRRSLLPLLDLP